MTPLNAQPAALFKMPLTQWKVSNKLTGLGILTMLLIEGSREVYAYNAYEVLGLQDNWIAPNPGTTPRWYLLFL